MDGSDKTEILVALEGIRGEISATRELIHAHIALDDSVQKDHENRLRVAEKSLGQAKGIMGFMAFIITAAGAYFTSLMK